LTRKKTDMKQRYADEQIIGFLRQAAAGAPIKDLRPKHGFSDAIGLVFHRSVWAVGAVPSPALQPPPHAGTRSSVLP